MTRDNLVIFRFAHHLAADRLIDLINLKMLRDQIAVSVLLTDTAINKRNKYRSFFVIATLLDEKEPTLKERRKSMSAVIYFVVGLVGFVFALISFTGLKHRDPD